MQPQPIVRDRLIDLKQYLIQRAANTGRGVKFNPRLLYMTVGKLDEHLGEDKRRAFFRAVFGAEHTKELTPQQQFAILLWAKPYVVSGKGEIDSTEKTVWGYDPQFKTDVRILEHATILIGDGQHATNE